MSLKDWEKNGWLRKHQTTPKEISSLFSLVERDLCDALQKEISLDWRFNIAYNAALQLATLVLYVSGYRTGRGESKHYRVIQSIPMVMGKDFVHIRNFLDNCRRKRNINEYDAVGTVSKKELVDLLEITNDFKEKVKKWLEKSHPDLL
ncbi:MAG: hypothetical protein R6V00_07890 [Candidatus Aminicenantes bacterium]